MVNRIAGFFAGFARAVLWIVRRLFAAIAWPFRHWGRAETRRGWAVRGIVLLVVLVLVGLYANFFWQTQTWTNFNPDYVAAYKLHDRQVTAGEAANANQNPPAAQPPAGQTSTTIQGSPASQKSCAPSAIATVTADLIDFNVNQNQWISSMILYKLGFFGLDWDDTPFFDNKASFQRGINQAVRRTTVELVDTLGRVRGTSQVDSDLQAARGNMQFGEYTWYLGWNPPGPKTPTPTYYRSAIKSLRAFNKRLAACQVTFDARADNLIQFIDRIANDIGSTSAILKDRAENHHNGWFDFRADDRFWFAYGQLYGYYGLLAAAQADFDDVIKEKKLTPLWDNMLAQLRSALRIQPFIVANGREDGWIVPSHLTTMGFYVLRVRSNLVDIMSVLRQ
ncbi:MAG TPA: DUF2333 family protein [Rhizobiaceae bacterium]|nr:DUF2333 family protein [Rhizobiaceae bacterium]